MKSLLSVLLLMAVPGLASAESFPSVRVTNVRKVFDNGEHNAFTDLIRFRDRYFLTFRSCPDGHMVHPSASIIVLSSDDLKDWKQVYEFNVPLRDTRDPHFLLFQNKLFIYTGTWYCGQTSPPRSDYDLNQHLGYAVISDDGEHWSEPKMLEGTFGHYIWKASALGDKAYLCGRRKHQFDVRPRGEGPNVESAMLESEDGIVWRTKALFQETRGDETAFQFEVDGRVIAVGRRGGDAAQLLIADPPYTQWARSDLGRYIGGPLLVKWGQRWVVGGRNNTAEGPRTSMNWLDLSEPENPQLIEFAELPSGGDNSYPGFVEISPTRAVMSWYSSHEKNADGQPKTSIYMADLEIVPAVKSKREKFSFPSTHDQSQQQAYLSVPQHTPSANNSARIPMVVSLHSWSGDLEQRQPELEQLVAERQWFCLQPNFRGVNDDPLACGSEAAQQDVIDAVHWAIEHHPIDPERIYLTGTSGGGHMTMLLAANFPTQWAAASAWVGISDLTTWHEKHAEGRYGAMLRACCGGAPGDSAAVDAQYHARSPIYFLSAANGLPLDIAAGIHDGHTGSVPIQHSIDAFNAIAQSAGLAGVSETELRELSLPTGRLSKPQPQDEGLDPSFQRDHYLRRQANRARLTIFEGGHEGIATAAMAWFDAHPKREPSAENPARE